MDKFKEFLTKLNLSENTERAYLVAVRLFFSLFDEITKNNLLLFKNYLTEHYKPKSVNLKIQAVNRYLDYSKKGGLKLKSVKIQQKTFLENVISDEDYSFFKQKLKKDGRVKWYFVIRLLAATGARISELLQMKIDNLRVGYIDLYTKGGKNRRIFIPKAVRTECLSWTQETKQAEGYLFVNRSGKKITQRGISQQLKKYAIEYGINPKVVYPHSFRHRFAKNFLAKFNDIALLADLLGHESIETTRIYLRRTSNEQQEIVDKIVNW
ncbi:MAG: tyrosine-type recombinase/integrase [Bacilli bacterium]|jgi:integrase/recombinase XerD|nr:tyrosine-type recombinase/integrase [Bacilli bacterium]